MQDLPDVGAIGDGEVFVYDDGTEAFVGVVLVDPGSIATDLAALAAEVATKQSSATAATDAELAAHNADGTFVHGITNTADLAYTADARFPTTGQKSALAGSSGTPGSGNTYVTNADVRNANARTPTAHVHPQSEVTDLVTDLAAKQDASTAATDSELTAGLALKQATSEKGQANGYASLSAGGTVPSSQIPALALTDVSVVASQAAQLALTAEEGDVAVRSDETKTYVHNGGTAGTMADWTFLQTPASSVLSVNGETGVVVLDATDVGAATSGDITSAVAAHESDTTVHGVDTANVPSSGQKAALAGTSGTPSGTNLYATKATTDTLSTDLAGKQPLDTDLTAIAALTSTSFGRGLLELANQAALLSAAGAAAASHSHAQSDVTGLVAALVAKMDDGEAAGGVLSGTFPNPGFAVDMATQAELDAVAAGAVVPYASLAKVGVD